MSVPNTLACLASSSLMKEKTLAGSGLQIQTRLERLVSDIHSHLLGLFINDEGERLGRLLSYSQM